MKRALLVIFMILAFGFDASAQEQQTSGVPFNGLVLDGQGKGIARMRVEVKDSEKRTVTDKQGRFGLTNIDEGTKLIISQKGINNVTIDVGGRHSLKVVVDNGKVVEFYDSQELEDAGFRYVKRRENLPTGLVLGEDLRRTHQTDLEQALLARVPGLTKMNGEIVIRGVGSVNSSSQALILVDGSEVSSLSAVSIQEVETVEVIKSASSYGVRGANGVISIKLRTR